MSNLALNVTIYGAEGASWAGNHIDGAFGAIKPCRASASSRALLRQGRSRAESTDVTAQREVGGWDVESDRWARQRQTEHKGGLIKDVITQKQDIISLSVYRWKWRSMRSVLLCLPRRAEPRGGSQSRGATISPWRAALTAGLIGQPHLPAEGTSWAWECYTRLCSCR